MPAEGNLRKGPPLSEQHAEARLRRAFRRRLLPFDCLTRRRLVGLEQHRLEEVRLPGLQRVAQESDQLVVRSAPPRYRCATGPECPVPRPDPPPRSPRAFRPLTAGEAAPEHRGSDQPDAGSVLWSQARFVQIHVPASRRRVCRSNRVRAPGAEDRWASAAGRRGTEALRRAAVLRRAAASRESAIGTGIGSTSGNTRSPSARDAPASAPPDVLSVRVGFEISSRARLR